MKIGFAMRGLQRQKGGRVVLEIPELDLFGPGLVALVGDNGAGKTTLLRLLSGVLEQPDNGTIGCSVAALSVVMMDQSPYLFSGTVADNVGYGLMVRGVPRGVRQERVRGALERVGLPGYEPRRARALSGGEQRRVALARALAVAPKILLLDEPDAGLDRSAVAGLERLIAGLGEDRLVLFSTHDQARAGRLADRVLKLSYGRLAPVAMEPETGGGTVAHRRAPERTGEG